MDADDLLRAVRRERRLSQRRLAALAGVAPSTIDGIESGRRRRPSMAVIDQILCATGYYFAVVTTMGYPLRVEDGRFAPWDRGFRQFPAHVVLRPVRDMRDSWWGWNRVAFCDRDPNKAEWTFTRHEGSPWSNMWWAERWRWCEAT